MVGRSPIHDTRANRLRLAALVAGKARGVKIGAALKNYDAALPFLKSMRDVREHIDVYAVDSSKRFNKDISRRRLQTGAWDGTTFSWAIGGALNIDRAHEAAELLFAAVRNERQKFPNK
jgi:hypothetical protein